jgi:D-alanyl-D-alanine carboxypeptidase
VTGEALPRVFEGLVFEPLGLRRTYAYTDLNDERPARMYAGERQVHLPRYMASITAEGGLVSTAEDLLEIGRAFFDGTFFDIERFMAQQNWRLLFWPGQFYFGMGLEKMWTPWFFSPLRPIRDVMGFWGQSGAFLFHHPETGLHFAGTVNQVTGRGHASAVRAMLRIIAAHPAARRRRRPVALQQA